MMYYPKHNLSFFYIFKNGSQAFRELFTYVMEGERDTSDFVNKPEINITIVRNPYDRLVSQFYHANKGEIYRNWRLNSLGYQKLNLHYPLFKSWVRDTFNGGYKGSDEHMYSQPRLLKYFEGGIEYKVFKLEELVSVNELFFFMELTKERQNEIDIKYSEILRGMEKINHHATNTVKQGVWQNYYDAKTIEICNKEFEGDFIAFNYKVYDPKEFNKII